MSHEPITVMPDTRLRDADNIPQADGEPIEGWERVASGWALLDDILNDPEITAPFASRLSHVGSCASRRRDARIVMRTKRRGVKAVRRGSRVRVFPPGTIQIP